jgi:hypothetical protein
LLLPGSSSTFLLLLLTLNKVLIYEELW